jgi:hypothetical protein
MISLILRPLAIAGVEEGDAQDAGCVYENEKLYWMGERPAAEVRVTGALAAVAEQSKAAVAAPVPWLPGEAGRDGEPTWAGPRSQGRGRQVRVCDEAAPDMLVEERVGMWMAGSGGHGRICGRREFAA